jgi:hypothetical protein
MRRSVIIANVRITELNPFCYIFYLQKKYTLELQVSDGMVTIISDTVSDITASLRIHTYGVGLEPGQKFPCYGLEKCDLACLTLVPYALPTKKHK